MRKEYDFDKMKGRKNPYAGHLKKREVIRTGDDVIEHSGNSEDFGGKSVPEKSSEL